MNHQMSPVSKAVLAYVVANPNCTVDKLLAAFCPDCVAGKGSTVNRFRARLAYLVSVGHLRRVSSDNVQLVPTYLIGTGMPPAKAHAAQPCRVASTVAHCSVRVPSPSYDRMHAPAYVPEAGPVIRPGSLNYKQLASVGCAC